METPPLAKGNDGNYLQHCVEVEAAVRLVRACPDGRLHVALTHGMAPFEQIDQPNGNARRLLYGALREAASEHKRNEREIVKAYRASWKSQAYQPDTANLLDELKTGKHYPSSAELLQAVIGTNRLSGGITERDEAKHKELADSVSARRPIPAGTTDPCQPPGGFSAHRSVVRGCRARERQRGRYVQGHGASATDAHRGRVLTSQYNGISSVWTGSDAELLDATRL